MRNSVFLLSGFVIGLCGVRNGELCVYYLKKYFSFFENMGSNSSLSSFENRRILWINQLTFICFFSAFLYAWLFIFFGFFKLSLGSFFFAALFSCSFLLNKYRFYLTSQLWLFFSSNISVVFFAVITGPRLNFDSFLISLLALSMVGGSFLKSTQKIMIVLMPLLSYFLIHFFLFNLFPPLFVLPDPICVFLNHSFFVLNIFVIYFSVNLLFQSYLDRESELVELIDEKGVLLKEIHHRVKNSLQLSSSLISLKLQDTDNQAFKEAMTSFKYRILAIAKLHDVLQLSDQLNCLDFRCYLINIVNPFKTTAFSALPVPITLDMPDNFWVSVKYGHCLGIIVTELLSNSLKHAFDGVENPCIRISIQEPVIETTESSLIYEDNGIGFDCDFSKPQSSFGLKLIQLFSKQLSADVTLDMSNGFRFQLTTPYLTKTHDLEADQLANKDRVWERG